jgi:predicted TPR repeat methyltransferase
VDVESLLDLGCGRGIVGALCRIYRAPRRLVGFDAWEPYLGFC